MSTPTAHHRRRRPPAPGVLRLLAAASAGLAGLVGVASGWGSVALPVVGLLAALVAVAELVVLPAGRGPSRWAASLTEGAVAACLLVGDGAWSVVAVGAGVAAAQTVRRCPRRKRELDLAVRLLATAVAQAVCGAVGGGATGAVAGLAGFWLVTSLLLAAAVAAVSSRSLPSLVVWIVRRSALHTAGSSCVGLLAAWVAQRAPLALLGLVVGVAVARTAYGSAAERRGEAQRFAHLAQANGGSPDACAQLLGTAAARLLGGADVELVVLDGPLATRFSGDERGHTSWSSDVVALDEPWVLAALAKPPVRRSHDGDRPTLSAVLHRAGWPTAVLRARRPAGAPDFDRQDLRSIDVLVASADAWLAVPADGGAVARGTGGARLRASVERLDALAGRGATAAQVAAELHELERAVASLLGNAGLPAAAVPQQRSAPAAEWTTTGVVR